MAIVRRTLDPAIPPKLAPAERARLETMTDAEITAAALADPDNLPLTEAELEQLDMRRLSRAARERTGLSQSQFARTFRINLARLRDLEQGRYKSHDSALSAYLTPSCRAFLQQDYEYRRASGELRQRVRGIYEIPGRGYGDDPATRVKVLSDRDWVVTLDVSADEYYGSEQVKRALVRYPLKVMRIDVDPKRNPFGLVIDCYASAPQRIATPSDTTKTTSHPEDTP